MAEFVRRHPWVWAVFAGVILLPFCVRPPTMDDPLFLWVAEQMWRDPFHPFATTVNWTMTSLPLSEMALNPVMVPLLMAVPHHFLGPTAAHGVIFVFALVTGYGVLQLAQLMRAPAVPALLLACATPAFVVSATTLMCDVAMLACMTWAVVYCFRLIQQPSKTRALTDHIGLCLCTLAAVESKYFALSLFLLLPFALTVGRAWSRGVAAALVFAAVGVMLVDALVSQGLARSHLVTSVTYAAQHGLGLRVFDRVVQSGVYVSLCVPTGIVLVSTQKRLIATLLATAILLVLVVAHGNIGGCHLSLKDTTMLVHVAFGLFVFIGTSTVLLSAISVQRRPDEAFRSVMRWTLLAWVLGTICFACVLNWTLSARAVLPLTVPLGLLISDHLQGLQRWQRFALGLCGLLSLQIAWSDLQLALAERDAADAFAAAGPAEHLWFQGHWGFQWTMEHHGARPLDARGGVATGDLVGWQSVGSSLRAFPSDWLRVERVVGEPVATWADTRHSAGFYSTIYGCLPWQLGPPPTVPLVVARAMRPIGRNGHITQLLDPNAW